MLRLLFGVLIGVMLGWLARQYVEEQESGAGWPAPAEPVAPEPREEPSGAGEPAAGMGLAETTSGLMAYCARCRTKRPMASPQPTTTETGRSAVRGVCPVCGTSMFRFVRSKA